MSGKSDTEDRTGRYGGDDGALEHERAETQPGTDAVCQESPVGAHKRGKTSDTVPAQRDQEKDLKTGEENPG